jgi:hypothetical protein
MKLNLHKRAGAWFMGIGGAHHVYDMAREHIFLAIHEYISHAGWIVYSVAGIALLIGAPTAIVLLRKSKEASSEDSQ